MEQKFVCDICGTNFTQRKSFLRHFHSLHENKNRKNFKCVNCNAEFSRRESVIRHLQRHCQRRNKNTSYICDVCEQKFTYRYSFIRHYRTLHEKEDRKILKDSDFVQHARLFCQKQNSTYICEICNRTFTRRQTFMRHCRFVHESAFQKLNLSVKLPVFECASCHKQFKRKDILIRHQRRCQRLANLTNDEYVCAFCYKSFTQKWVLRRHIDFHLYRNKEVPCPVVGSMKCAFCEDSFSSKNNILDHFMRRHEIQIDHQHIKFTSRNKFDEWRTSMQKLTVTSFRRRDIQQYKQWSVIRFVCHRSGSYEVKTSNRKKRLKPQGTKKLGSFCPAEISLRVNNTDGSCKVSYVSTHLGHKVLDKEELAHIYLTKEERSDIALKIAIGIPSQSILIDNMSSTRDAETDPLYYLNKRDLWNISRDFKVMPVSKIAFEEDPMNINAFITKHEKSILYYKRQNEVDEKYVNILKPDDMFIIIMTPFQEEMLIKYGHRVIAVDETFGLNRYEFFLHTLLVVDDLHERIPVVFLISNRSDEVLIEMVLESIREKVGILCPETLISEVLLMYKNSWEKIMGPVKFRLYCSWHVFEDWRKNLRKIKNANKRELMQKRLYELLVCLDENIFTVQLQQLLEDPDEELQTFLMYFKIRYSTAPESWAYCYRKHDFVNTNAYADVFNRNLKYLRGKLGQNPTFSNYLQLLNTYLDDMERSLKRKTIKGRVSGKLLTLRKIHDAFEKKLNNMKIKVFCNIANQLDGEWEVSIFDVNTEVANAYRLHKCDDNNCESCELFCEKCDTCLHAYQCNCIENMIWNNMCEHIHALCMIMKIQKNTLNVQNRVDVLAENVELPHDHVQLHICDDEELQDHDDKNIKFLGVEEPDIIAYENSENEAICNIKHEFT